MKSKFKCPSCRAPLAMEEHPTRSKVNPKPYIVIFCGNVRCPSDAAQKEGGSGPTEEEAYRSLDAVIDHETESELDPIEQKDRIEWEKAEHKNDMEKAGGA